VSDDYEMLLPFDSDEPQFTLGFEMGRIWAETEDTEGEREFTIHAANVEMVLRIAEARLMNVTSVELGDEWLEVTFCSSGGDA
jgi:hypothetical protein